MMADTAVVQRCFKWLQPGYGKRMRAASQRWHAATHSVLQSRNRHAYANGSSVMAKLQQTATHCG
jgi:hypothetical protein